MGISAAVNGYGSKFSIGNKADGTSTSWTDLAEVTDITDPEIEVTSIEVSNLGSPGAYKEFIPGMVNPGAADLRLNYLASGKTELLSLIRVKHDIRITFSDALSTSTSSSGSTLVMPAFLQKMGGDIPNDNKISSKATFKMAGQPVFTTAT